MLEADIFCKYEAGKLKFLSNEIQLEMKTRRQRLAVSQGNRRSPRGTKRDSTQQPEEALYNDEWYKVISSEVVDSGKKCYFDDGSFVIVPNEEIQDRVRRFRPGRARKKNHQRGEQDLDNEKKMTRLSPPTVDTALAVNNLQVPFTVTIKRIFVICHLEKVVTCIHNFCESLYS